jgi:hypothetical protein
MASIMTINEGELVALIGKETFTLLRGVSIKKYVKINLRAISNINSFLNFFLPLDVNKVFVVISEKILSESEKIKNIILSVRNNSIVLVIASSKLKENEMVILC